MLRGNPSRVLHRHLEPRERDDPGAQRDVGVVQRSALERLWRWRVSSSPLAGACGGGRLGRTPADFATGDFRHGWLRSVTQYARSAPRIGGALVTIWQR